MGTAVLAIALCVALVALVAVAALYRATLQSAASHHEWGSEMAARYVDLQREMDRLHPPAIPRGTTGPAAYGRPDGATGPTGATGPKNLDGSPHRLIP